MKMTRGLLLTLLLFAYAGPSPSQVQHTQPGWKCQQDGADCIGTVQLRVMKAFWPEAEGTFEIRGFSNGEWLFVNRTSDADVKFLKLRSNIGIFYGVRNDEEFWRQNEIFQHGVGRVLFLTFALIVSAYPEGIDTMKAQWTTRQIEFEGKQVQVSSRKSSATSFEFLFTSSPHWSVSGLWHLEKAAPWNDDYPLSGWSGLGQKTYRTLGELRKAHP
jgi:hypothetical protein